uniref:Uncharacterized protein n=1 Tax=Anguilla anguilla TaxID=7936 RepID=A0A0E9RF75_ANGAN
MPPENTLASGKFKGVKLKVLAFPRFSKAIVSWRFKKCCSATLVRGLKLGFKCSE